jgi:hypothetical protein
MALEMETVPLVLRENLTVSLTSHQMRHLVLRTTIFTVIFCIAVMAIQAYRLTLFDDNEVEVSDVELFLGKVSRSETFCEVGTHASSSRSHCLTLESHSVYSTDF